MTRKYILTGGPGSGKSSILLELEWRGEHIVREAAEDVIKRHQARGIARPWELPDFQKEILELQIQREERIPSHLKRAWIDRGIPDGFGYTREGTETHRAIQKAMRAYTGVFLIENLGSTLKTEVRREDYAAALKLEETFYNIYTTFGYRVPRIAPAAVGTRADRILEIVDSGRRLR